MFDVIKEEDKLDSITPEKNGQRLNMSEAYNTRGEPVVMVP